MISSLGTHCAYPIPRYSLAFKRSSFIQRLLIFEDFLRPRSSILYRKIVIFHDRSYVSDGICTVIRLYLLMYLLVGLFLSELS